MPKIIIKAYDLHKNDPEIYCMCGHKYEEHDDQICLDCGFPCWSMCEYETYRDTREW